MKTLSNLLLILVFVLCFSKTQLFAQSDLEPKEVIVIEFSDAKDINEKVEVEIPTKRFTGTSQIGFSECLFCTTPKEFEDFRSSSYEYLVEVSKLSRNESDVYFKIELDACKTRKGFKLYRKKKSTAKLKCGIRLVAYYGFETKEEN